MLDSNDSQWERKVLEKVALEAIAEQRRGRRWGIFFKLLGFGYLALILGLLVDWESSDKHPDGTKITALVNLNGVIKAKGDANAEHVISGLQAAFENKNTAGVILRINSPGGSPVQSGIINDEMKRLRAAHPAIPLHVVVEDVCASGGYYVAAAADKIFVDKASIVGSIGVLMDGFGFTGTMEKLGVERRLLTAGESKGFLDPFSPQNEQHKDHAKKMLNEIHQQFIDVVRQGRGKRLKETPDMFSGLMWSGARSIELGLADGYGTVDSVARDVFKAADVRDFSVRQNFAEKFAKQFGADMAESMANVMTRLTLR
ncbi:MAG: S49 family peptidase [Sulfuritalea sp.]|uniref:ClpP class periplasmic serine protease n=1 Tax=Sulfuritalea hydrogenivorans sk43H TaxID=1223802 RepID=W0SFH1_9PROT|nr:S49 family peptidase [Sulfuritalea hydrogenivorans]MDK9715744.1 S49 family peptidase [Sulfuritalea sp.]BAO29505.1 ClpP class periplasmic serine protease [Sulfuritalea hydrogenivorans sk43H]